jgi:hypothetical protein
MTLIVDGTSGVTFNDSSLQGAAASPYVLKNRIINGDMRIDQRNAGASVATTTANAGVYTLDRWFYYASQTNKYTVQQNAAAVTPPAGFTNYLGVTIAASTYTPTTAEEFGISQIIEGFNISDLGWGTANAQTITLSFWARSSVTGTFGGSLRQGSGTRSYPFTYTIVSANTWEKKSITIAGDTSGTWNSTNGAGIILGFQIGAGATASGTPFVWASANTPGATGALNLMATANATFYITGVQLEQNTVATPFERRLYNQELANCERYYQVIDYNGAPVNTYTGSSAGYTSSSISQMRAAPTTVFDTALAAAGSMYASFGVFACTYTINQPSTPQSVSWAAIRTSGTFGAGEFCAHTYIRLRFSAEL